MPYIGNIVQDFSVNNAMLNTDSVTSIKIDDGTIVNADINDSAAIAMSKLALSITNSEINASAAIAGTKISPDFGSQNITTTASLQGAGVNISATIPVINFTDTDGNPDYRMMVNSGVFSLRDQTNDTNRMVIASDGTTTFASNVDFSAGIDVTGAITGTAGLSINGATVFNESGADVDFRIESSGTANMFVLDAGNNRIGLNRPTPLEMFEVGGNIYITSNTSNANEGNALKFQTKTGGFSSSYGAAIHGLRVGDTSCYLRFDTGGQTERMRIDSSGRVGIGTTSPVAPLHVAHSGTSTAVGTNFISLRSGASGRDIGIQFADGATSAYVGMLGGAIYFADSGSSEKMRIDSSGRTLIGTTSILHSQSNKLYVAGTDSSTSISLNRYSDNTFASYIYFRKSRSGTIGGNTSVQDDDLLGRIYFEGNDGSSPVSAAYIEAHVDGTPGNQDMPGRLEFLTTADGSPTPVERMRIDSSGNIGIGTTSPAKKLHVYEAGVATIQLETGDSRGQAFNILSTNGAQNNTGTLSIRNEASQSFIDFSHNEGSPKTTISNTGSVQFRFDSDGLKFGSDTAAANALDDYEEGTFTPTMTYNTLQQAPQGTFTGQYQKVGNCVHFQARFTLTDEGSGIDNIRLSNLPFAPNTSGFTHPMATFFAINGVNIGDPDKMIVAQLQTNQYVFYTVGIADSDNYAAFNMNQIVDSAIFGCYGHYYTSS